MEIDIEYKGVQPRAAWRMSDKIQRWGITWRNSTPTNPDVSLGINGDLGSAIMMSHGMTLLVLAEVQDNKFPFALVSLLAVHPIRPGNGDDNYIAVVSDATMCHMELYAGAQERGLQFPDGFAEDGDDVLVTFGTMEAARDQIIKEHAKAVAKPTKQPHLKKSDAAIGVQEASDERAITGESSRPKRKSASASGGQGSKGKKPKGKLTLVAAIVQANNLTAKMKPADVEAMYKSLEDGLRQCFPYGQDPLQCKIPEDRIHLTPDSLKYRVFVEKRKEQVQLEREALGTIHRKLELYYVPLKRAPVPGGGPKHESSELILQQMPTKEMQWAIDGKPIPWYKTNVHWYVVGGQHTYQACVSIAAKEEPGSARHKFYTEFDVVLVYSRDPDMLIKVLNALNIQVRDKVITENFWLQLKNARAKWIEKGRPRPKLASAKYNPKFKVCATEPLYTTPSWFPFRA